MITAGIHSKILNDLDVGKFRRSLRIPGTVSNDTLLAAIHKARYESTEITTRKRLESADWLRKSGYVRLGGLPLLPGNELP